MFQDMFRNGMFYNGMCGDPVGQGRSGRGGLDQGRFGQEMPGENMFVRSLLQSSLDQRLRRSWTTLSSFGLQALAMGLLLMLPLVRPGRIPLLHRLAAPISLGQSLPDAPPMRAQAGPSTVASSNLLNNRVLEPSRIPSTIAHVVDNAPPQPYGLIGSGNPTNGVVGAGILNGILSGGGTRPVLPTAPPPTPHAIRISHMSPGSLIYQTQPVYPPMARAARIEGTVVLAALISRDGTIENLHVVTGHALLVGAAVEAVSRWRYRPYILNNEPVEVETQITVNFYLAH